MVVGLGLAGVSLMFLILQALNQWEDKGTSTTVRNLSAFGFGASSIALFARVAGGIYTKAADVGADLVGNVAGMGADLFESYVGSMIAAVALAQTGAQNSDPTTFAARFQLPGYLAAAGIICAMIGCFFVSTKEEGKGWDVKLSTLMIALEKGVYVAGILFVAAAYGICFLMFPSEHNGDFMEKTNVAYRIFGCIIIGLFTGMAIGSTTEYFPSFDYGPVISIKDRGVTGPATVVIQGIGVGMISCAPTVVLMVVCIMACAALDGSYGVAIAAVGMLATP